MADLAGPPGGEVLSEPRRPRCLRSRGSGTIWTGRGARDCGGSGRGRRGSWSRAHAVAERAIGPPETKRWSSLARRQAGDNSGERCRLSSGPCPLGDHCRTGRAAPFSSLEPVRSLSSSDVCDHVSRCQTTRPSNPSGSVARESLIRVTSPPQSRPSSQRPSSFQAEGRQFIPPTRAAALAPPSSIGSALLMLLWAALGPRETSSGTGRPTFGKIPFGRCIRSGEPKGDAVCASSSR
jgi:hypothetical protein